jgi:hypothetical protein
MRKLLSVFLIALSACWAQSAKEEKLPPAESILDRFVEVTGGRKAYESRTSETIEAKMSMAAQGIEASMIIHTAAPNKQRVVTDFPGIGKMEAGSDGKVYWEKSAVQGARIRKGEELPQARRQATMNAPLHWRTLYAKAETTGTDTVDGRPCYAVTLTPADGKPEVSCYDKETGLLVQTKLTLTTQMGEIPFVTRVTDYREVDGLRIPHRMTQSVAGQTIDILVKSVVPNPKLEAELFNLPDEVAALLEKEKAAREKPQPK